MILLILEEEIIFSDNIIAHLLSRFLFVFAICIPFDIRDVKYDNIKLKTIPIVFGIGAALTAAVGANIGAGQHARARRIAWTGAGVSFFVIGVVRSGTTSMYHYLDQHPSIVKSAYDELGFFDDNFRLGWSWYRSLFPTQMKKQKRW